MADQIRNDEQEVQYTLEDVRKLKVSDPLRWYETCMPEFLLLLILVSAMVYSKDLLSDEPIYQFDFVGTKAMEHNCCELYFEVSENESKIYSACIMEPIVSHIWNFQRSTETLTRFELPKTFDDKNYYITCGKDVSYQVCSKNNYCIKNGKLPSINE